MKVLVTGAAGMLGAATVRQFHAGGAFDLHACDMRSNPSLPIPCQLVNLLSREDCLRLLEGMDAVVHLANHSGERHATAETVYAENVAINFNVFHAAAELGVKKVIFSSSVQVIAGDRRYEPDYSRASCLSYLPADGDAPAKPGNAYALSKQVGEATLSYFANTSATSGIAIRFPGIFPSVEHLRARHRLPQLPGKFRPNLDELWTYLVIDDAVSLLAACLNAELPGFRLYFPSGRTPRIDLPIPEMISRFYSNVPLRVPLSELNSFVDLSRIETETGWSPKLEAADTAVRT